MVWLGVLTATAPDKKKPALRLGGATNPEFSPMLVLPRIGAARLHRRGDHRSSANKRAPHKRRTCIQKQDLVSLPPRGRGTAIAVEGACATMVLRQPNRQRICFCTHAPSVLPLGGEAKGAFATKTQQTHTAAHHFMRSSLRRIASDPREVLRSVVMRNGAKPRKAAKP